MRAGPGNRYPHQVPAGEVVIDVRDLRIHYDVPRGELVAVNGISFEVRRGETLGLVGESGSGKSTTAMGILNMVQPPGRIVGGEVWIEGEDFLRLPERELRDLRWRKVALIPQGAMNSLNPVMKVNDQIGDAITSHEGRMSRQALRERILGLLRLVRLDRRVYDLYPHELSGGMKQRVCIGMAIALSPVLVIADEPTSALDVIVQRVVAQTLLEVKERLGMSMILIGHDMGLQAQLVDRLAVMYAGNIVEMGPVEAVFGDPLHPYTRLLIGSIPSIKERKPVQAGEALRLRLPPPGVAVTMLEARPGHFVASQDRAQPEEGPAEATVGAHRRLDGSAPA